MPDFIDTLSRLCKEHLYEEKWLISPNRRVGFQIIDRISFRGQGVMNLFVKTMSLIVLDIISGFMASNNLTFINPLRQELLIGELFHHLKEKGGGYLSRLKSSTGLISSLRSSLSELRNAGISGHQLKAGQFEEPVKGKEILFLLSRYEKELKEKEYIDYAGALIQAITQMRSKPCTLNPGILIFAPLDMITHDFTPLEKQLWYAIPDNQRIAIVRENPAGIRNKVENGLSPLPVINQSPDAPDPVIDGSVDFFKAYGTANEVREVFRRIVHGGISFDQVEIIYTDPGTYVPLIFETAYQFPLDMDEMVPVSFTEGIPVKYSRLGQALTAWISWIENDYPQTVLRRMIRDGLLKINIQETGEIDFPECAHLLRQVRIGKGKNRYKEVLENHLAGLNNKRKYISRMEDESDEEYLKRKDQCNEMYRWYSELIQVVFRLLDSVPSPGASQIEIIHKAQVFMQTMVRLISKLDYYAADVMNKRIKELLGYLSGDDSFCFNEQDSFYLNKQDSFVHFDAWKWLRTLAEKTGVYGQGPREGCLYVSNIETGGYSGRRYTFLTGLDDARFPGTGNYDPVLLDQERSEISKDLPLMADVPGKKIKMIQRLFNRLKGRLTLSYSCMDIREDRECFPSQVLLSVYRRVSGNPEADQDYLAEVLQPAASFAPITPGHAVTIDEWWLGSLCGEQRAGNGREAVNTTYHHLADGFTAREMRESTDFTVFDGYVPDAGRDLNPYNEAGLVLSANMFERLAKSPIEFFFKYILCIEPLEDEEIDVNVWLDALSRGSLLHSVFQKFMITVRDAGERPSYNNHRKLIHSILTEHIRRERSINPPFHEYAYEHDLFLLKKAVDIFLNGEEEFCTTSIPSYFEVNIGIFGKGEFPHAGSVTGLDSKTPVCMELSEDKTIRVRARIDRIDLKADANPPVFSVWDYKTGRSRRYDRNDPFNKGRTVQNILYLLIAEKQLKDMVSKTASVSHFGYFFASLFELGQRISWPASLLQKGKEYLIILADMIRAGCFPCSFEKDDLKYTNYKDALIDVGQTVDQAMKKIQNPENATLDLLRRLRTGSEK